MMKLSAKWEFIESSLEFLTDLEIDKQSSAMTLGVLGETLMLFLVCRWKALSEFHREEIVDIAIERIVARIVQFKDRGRGSFRGWCLTILRRTAINWFRKQDRKGWEPEEQLNDREWATRAWLEQSESERGNESEIDRCLLKLDRTTLDVLRLRAEGLPYKEIAIKLLLSSDANARKIFERGKKELDACIRETDSANCVEQISAGET